MHPEPPLPQTRQMGMLTQFGPWVTSGILHAGLLLVLAVCMIPMEAAGVMFATVFSRGEQFGPDDLNRDTPLALPLLDVSDKAQQGQQSSQLNTAASELLESPAQSLLESRVIETFDNMDAQGVAAGSTGHDVETKHAVSIEGAVDRITGQIQGQLQDSDLLVVWLLDSSQSLVDDRQRIAQRLEPFFRELAAGRDGGKFRLLNAVVSFGSGMRERVPPTDFGPEVIEAVKHLHVDESGRELVFTAITRCVTKYRQSSRKTHLMLIVWTDETGDDADKLESTIRVCRGQGVSVSVVGPSSVLGAETGLHAYRDPQSNAVYQLPIRRGPDTAVPERLSLGYWFPTRPPLWSANAVRVAVSGPSSGLPSWYGDRDLQGMVSGLSPYALTRLARETGGTYTIFDRPEDRGPFDMELMRKYLPEYVTEAEYREQIARHPLRRAIQAAVKLTASTELRHPKLALFGRYSKVPPYRFERFYFTPQAFRKKVKSSRRLLTRDADRMTRVVDRALAELSRDGNLLEGLDADYEQEMSPRWRAWYDLTRGRLLATSVRLEEYRLACELLVDPEFFQDNSNHLIFTASRTMRSAPEFRARGDQALMLLRRCVSEHPGTPWAYLAQREMDYALGIGFQQTALTPIGPRGNGRAPTLPKF